MRETTVTSLLVKNPRNKSAKPVATSNASESMSVMVRDLVEVTLVNKSAHNVVVIDLKGKSDIADYMIVASGNSTRHVSALGDNVVEVLKKVGINPLQMEGEGGSEWVVVDNPHVIVHIFHPQTREIYNLEKMWEAEFNPA